MNETVLDMEEDAWDELQHETIIGKAGNRRELLGYTIRGYTHIQIHIDIIRAFFQLVALLGANEQHLLNSTLTLPKLRPPPTPFP